MAREESQYVKSSVGLRGHKMEVTEPFLLEDSQSYHIDTTESAIHYMKSRSRDTAYRGHTNDRYLADRRDYGPPIRMSRQGSVPAPKQEYDDICDYNDQTLNARYYRNNVESRYDPHYYRDNQEARFSHHSYKLDKDNDHRRLEISPEPRNPRVKSPLSIYSDSNDMVSISQPVGKDTNNTSMRSLPALLPVDFSIPEIDVTHTEISPQSQDHAINKKPASEQELCLICGDRASGYHYNALSCEGCKGFFRRSITRAAVYRCKYGDNCEMDMWMRRRCQACRLKRCRQMGMREECLLSDRQCMARNARRQVRKAAAAAAAADRRGVARGSTSAESSQKGEDNEKAVCSIEPLDKVVSKLCMEHRELVLCLVSYQDRYEMPSEEDMAKLSDMNVSGDEAPVDIADAIFIHMVEMTILVTRLIIEFAKALPGFDNICKEDQIILLKGSASEVMTVRTARRYDPQTDMIMFGNGQPFSSNSMSFGGLQGYIDKMFDFSRGMARIMVDEAEYALLTALCIFSERAGLKDPVTVRRVQEVYLDVLLGYISVQRQGNRLFLPRLLSKLVELRSISHEHTQVLHNMKLEKKKLPPLLLEYFDVPP